MIDAGRVVQAGTADDLLHMPANPFVAAFVGTNYFTGTATRRGAGTEVVTTAGARLVSADSLVGEVAVIVDPWQVRVGRPATAPARQNMVCGPVAQLVRRGSTVCVTLDSRPPVLAELSAEDAANLEPSITA